MKSNVFICPPCGESVAGATKEGQNKNKALWPLLPRLTAVLPPQGREMSFGFTLIELLVVVLIIGILAAVAVPQYNVAVLKSRYMRMVTVAESFKSAQERYYLAEGAYSPSIRNLDIDIAGEEVTEPFSNNEAYKVDNFYVFSSDAQIATYWVDKEDNLYMMYNLCLDHISDHCGWDGAHSLCRAYDRAGAAGRKVCNSLPGAFNCQEKTSKKYYQCFGR